MPPALRRFLFTLAGLGLLAAGGLLAVKTGRLSSGFTWGEVFAWMTGGDLEQGRAVILTQIRLPRTLMAIATGAILAVAGAVYQALLRNPLAGPYTLGVSGGATFGAVLTIYLAGRFGLPAWLPAIVSPIQLAALAGASVSIALIYLLAVSAGRFSAATIILAGVTLNMVFAALILFLEYLGDYTQVYNMIRWMMGGLDVAGYGEVKFMAVVVAIGMFFILPSMRELDLIAVDPQSAATMGVRVEAVRWRLLLAASLMTGCVVAFAGPIGFVGLIVPHCVRMALGAAHERVVPASIVAGGLFLLACDILAQNVLAEADIPLGVITAMLGGPFFLFLLLRRGGGAIWSE